MECWSIGWESRIRRCNHKGHKGHIEKIRIRRCNRKEPSAAQPEPKKRLGIGSLTAKGAKSAKKELGISPAKHVLSDDEGAPRRKGKIVISNEERNLS